MQICQWARSSHFHSRLFCLISLAGKAGFLIWNRNFQFILVPVPAGTKSPKSLEGIFSESTEACCSRDGQSGREAERAERSPGSGRCLILRGLLDQTPACLRHLLTMTPPRSLLQNKNTLLASTETELFFFFIIFLFFFFFFFS